MAAAPLFHLQHKSGRRPGLIPVRPLRQSPVRRRPGRGVPGRPAHHWRESVIGFARSPTLRLPLAAQPSKIVCPHCRASSQRTEHPVMARSERSRPTADRQAERRLRARSPRQDPITQRKERCPPPRGARCAQVSIVYGIRGRLGTKTQLRATLLAAAVNSSLPGGRRRPFGVRRVRGDRVAGSSQARAARSGAPAAVTGGRASSLGWPWLRGCCRPARGRTRRPAGRPARFRRRSGP